MQEITHGVADAYRVYDHNGLARTLKSEGGGLGAKTGLYTSQELCIIDKPVGTRGGTGALKIKNVGIDHAGTVTARYYKGLSANSCNAVITGIDLTTNNPKQTEIARCLQARYNKGYSTRAAECTGVMIAPVSSPEITKKTQNGRRMKEPGDPMVTLTGRDRHGIAIEGQGAHKIRIRKLTPRECWRLQGFPDEYFDRAKATGISDTQLYKQAGNAVTVNVARVIGERLTEIEGD